MCAQRNGEYRKCQVCNSEFYVYPRTIRKGMGKFCSAACFGASKAGERVLRRNTRVPIPHPDDDTAMLVPLTRGLFAVIDATDADLLDGRNWFASVSKTGLYAANNVNGEMRYLHRVILGLTDPDSCVDHRDGDTLNNRRSNLRLATKAQNCTNTRRAAGKCGYRGVWLTRYGRYAAVFRRKHYGCYDTPEEAARVWDGLARRENGEFAVLNFPDE